jgi:hypothetical protein
MGRQQPQRCSDISRRTRHLKAAAGNIVESRNSTGGFGEMSEHLLFAWHAGEAGRLSALVVKLTMRKATESNNDNAIRREYVKVLARQ